MITVVLLYLIMIKLGSLDSARKFAPIYEKNLQIDFVNTPCIQDSFEKNIAKTNQTQPLIITHKIVFNAHFN